MSPNRRRSTYRPPRPRKEVAFAVLCAVLVVAVTATLVFAFRPRGDSGLSDGEPITVPPPVESTPPPVDPGALPAPGTAPPPETAPAPVPDTSVPPASGAPAP